MSKPRFFTGIQSTGIITLGHYCGVINHILALQEKYEVIIMIADLHALTIPRPDIDYRENSYRIATLLHACGLKEENCKIFIQSEVKEHLELAFFLSPHVTVGNLGDMIQYKEKKKENETGSLALLSYPVLMAADIFLYDADLVIVGQDQKQHLELTSEIAQKFNNFIGSELLKIPHFSIPQLGAKIMGLQNPEKKMSKSESDHISLLDSPDEVKKKVSTAVTDSENTVYYHPQNKLGISNLLVIYSLLSNKELKEIEKEMINLNYHQFKLKVTNLINEKLESIQKNYKVFFPRIKKLLEENSKYLGVLAEKKINLIKNKIRI